MSSKSSMQSTKLARQVMRRCLNDVHKAAAIILFIGISNVFISDIGFKRPLSHWVNTASVLLKLWIVLVSNIFCYNSEIFIVEVMSQCLLTNMRCFRFSSMRAIFVWFPGIVSLYGYRHLRFRWDSPFMKNDRLGPMNLKRKHFMTRAQLMLYKRRPKLMKRILTHVYANMGGNWNSEKIPWILKFSRLSIYVYA